MKNFRKSKKALSPVVASIILIAVTVAVSIAVAAWMGALTVGFMGTSSVTITNLQFTNDGATPPADTIVLTIKNTGTKSVTITQAKVNNNAATMTQTTYAAGAIIPTLTLSGTNAAWTEGNPYKIDLVDSSGQIVGSYQATAPN